MGKNARMRDKGVWQTNTLNTYTQIRYFDDIIRIASNRFRWEGLPDSVNVKFLEQTLLKFGMATIAHPKGAPDMWYGLQVGGIGDLNAYGEPVSWRAQGVDAKTSFDVDASNGVLVYNSNQIYGGGYNGGDSMWLAFELFARKLAHYDRTEDVNLMMQQAAWFITCQQEKRQEALNLFKQVSGFEPAVMTSPNVQSEIGFDVLKTDVPFIGDALNTAKRNVWNAVYEYLGVPHLSFEKGERMIEQEAEGNNAPTSLRLLDGLKPRRTAAQQLGKLLGNDVDVVFNKDFESHNFNLANTAEDTEGVGDADSEMV